MLGGPHPNHDYKSGYFEYNEGSPVLLKGEEAMLFLVPYKDDEYEVQNFSGYYKIVQGNIKALEHNRFKDEIEGLSAIEFANLIAAAP
jgi:hypothetical protein